MDWKILAAGAALLFIAVIGHSTELSGSCDTSSIQCDLTLQNMQACNDSSETQNYSAYFSGEIGNWFNILPDKFTLNSGECTDLRIYTVANCYANPGQYSAQLTIQNGKSPISTMCTFNLEQGHFLDIGIEPDSQQATQCEEKTYEIKITNNTIVQNQTTERADISVTGLPADWYSLEQTSVLVKKGQTQTVKLKVKAPCEAEIGKYAFTVRASTPNPQFFAQDSAEFNIVQGQGTQIMPGKGFTGKNLTACIDEKSEAQIKIANNGKLKDNYNLTLTGATFAKLDRTTIAVEPGKEETVLVKFAENIQKIGKYDFSLEIKSTLYDFSVTKNFSAQLEDCYNVEVTKFAGDENLCTEEAPTYKFRLENNESKPVEMSISFSGIALTSSNQKMTLAAGESKEIVAKLDISGLAKEASVTKDDIAAQLLFDTSGSMAETSQGAIKINSAKTAIINLVNNISQIELGLRVFGQGEMCENSAQLVEVSELDIDSITAKISTLSPKGKTPLSEALKSSATDFKDSGKKKVLIVVSDGKETCGGNVAQAARELAAGKIVAYTIGFDIDEDGKKQLERIANITKGKYYNAQSATELSDVLKQISQELNITLGENAARTLTLKIDSNNFHFEKDYSLVASDCYSAAILVPQVNACAGVEKSDFFTIANLGSKKQEFGISYQPSWVKGPSKITLDAGQKSKEQFSIKVPKSNTESKFTITAKSNMIEIKGEKNINMLSNASCYGIDIIMQATELDAATCEGKKQFFTIENRSAAEQSVNISTDKNYVTIAQKSIKLKSGERKEISYFVLAPFDLPSTTPITFRAITDNGFTTEAKVKLNVEGNEGSFGIGEIDVRLVDLNFSNARDGNYDAEVNFGIFNDSNHTLEVFNAPRVLDYNGLVELANQTIGPGKTAKATLFVNLPDGQNLQTTTVPISIETNQGTYTRNIAFTKSMQETYDNNQSGIPVKADQNVAIGTGLVNLTSLSTAILGLLVLIVIALIAYSSYRAVKAEPAQMTEEETQKEITQISPKMADKKISKKKK